MVDANTVKRGGHNGGPMKAVVSARARVAPALARRSYGIGCEHLARADADRREELPARRSFRRYTARGSKPKAAGSPSRPTSGRPRSCSPPWHTVTSTPTPTTRAPCSRTWAARPPPMRRRTTGALWPSSRAPASSRAGRRPRSTGTAFTSPQGTAKKYRLAKRVRPRRSRTATHVRRPARVRASGRCASGGVPAALRPRRSRACRSSTPAGPRPRGLSTGRHRRRGAVHREQCDPRGCGAAHATTRGSSRPTTPCAPDAQDKATPATLKAIDAVSARITTAAYNRMSRDLSENKQDPADVAAAFLVGNGSADERQALSR